MNTLQQFEKDQMDQLLKDNNIPNFRAGDTLKVLVKVIEGTNERMQAFEGVCIARRNKAMGSSFTVRKLSYGEGVERIFPLFSPNIKIEVVRFGDVRRAKFTTYVVVLVRRLVLKKAIWAMRQRNKRKPMPFL